MRIIGLRWPVTAVTLGRAVRAVASDVTPLRESPPFRRLVAGQAISLAGTQATQVAVSLQVYAITRSSLDVGLVGVFGLVPLIAFGVFGGAIADAVDRRALVLVTSTISMLLSAALLAQAALHLDQVGFLFGCVALQAASAAANSPARRAVIPQLLRREVLPAANTLVYGTSTLAVIVGPLAAGTAIAVGGYQWAYAIDVVSFGAALYAAARLPQLPPGETARRAGLASVAEGLRYLARQRIVMMTFLVDFNAMLFAQPRALFPALAQHQFGGGARTAGLLYAAPAVGAFAATLVGGAVSQVRRQGLGVVISIAVWSIAVTLFGLASALWLSLLLLAISGAADTVSVVYRSTILQVATPSQMQGRLQGVYFVAMSSGLRLGDIRAGGMADAIGPRMSVVCGGLASIVGLALLAFTIPAFIRYDTRDTPLVATPAA